MTVFGDMWELLTSRSDFFADLALEHLAISLSAAVTLPSFPEDSNSG